MAKTDLRIDWATHKAAKYACEHWHYSKCMPLGKLIKIGVWEYDTYIGCILFGRGANPNMGRKYGLNQIQCCELTRIALKKHDTAVTRIVAIAIRRLKKRSPGTRLIVSYADMDQDHYGQIYQAGNWIYTGIADKAGGFSYFINGKWQHKRSLGAKYGRRDSKYLDKLFPNAPKKKDSDKHRYLMPLDSAMRESVAYLAKPYPKRPKKHDSGDQPESGRGSTDPGAPISIDG